MALVKYNNNSLSNVTAAAGLGSSGSMNLLTTNTISSGVSTSSFTSSIDSTYDTYLFKFINIHPAEAAHFTFQGSTNGGSSYGVTLTSTYFHATHNEAGTSQALSYVTGKDLAQSTSYLRVSDSTSTDADESTSGELYLFNPSSTTFIKHFITNTNFSQLNDLTMNFFTAGYGNTTSAIDAVQFSQDSGTIQSGTIKMYGVV